MTGSDSDIDLSIANIWRAWFAFRKGKRNSSAIVNFEYYLESNLMQLCADLNSGAYLHSEYDRFVVHDTKKRDISVASVRDRVIHRLLYDYLVSIWDKTFIYDVWSCRKGKGLTGAIDRAQFFMQHYPKSYVWRADIHKMFDSINQTTMKQLLERRINGTRALSILGEVIGSYDALASKQASKQASKGYLLAV